jgi:hypothetical protein
VSADRLSWGVVEDGAGMRASQRMIAGFRYFVNRILRSTSPIPTRRGERLGTLAAPPRRNVEVRLVPSSWNGTSSGWREVVVSNPWPGALVGGMSV